MKLLIQTIAGRFGYFIIKKTTLDKLTELTDTQAKLAQTMTELAETKKEMRALREQNRALFEERKRFRTRLADNQTSAHDLGPSPSDSR